MATGEWTEQTRTERVEAMITDLLGIIPEDRRKHIESLANEAKTQAFDSQGLDPAALYSAGDGQSTAAEDFIDFR